MRPKAGPLRHEEGQSAEFPLRPYSQAGSGIGSRAGSGPVLDLIDAGLGSFEPPGAVAAGLHPLILIYTRTGWIVRGNKARKRGIAQLCENSARTRDEG